METLPTNSQVHQFALAFFFGLLLLCLGSLRAQPVENPSKSVLKYYQRARQAERARDFKKAVSYFKKVLRKEPRFLAAHQRLIYIYTMMFNEKELLEALRFMVKSLPRLSAPRVGLSERLLARGAYTEASLHMQVYFEVEKKPTKEAKHLNACINYALKAMSEQQQIRTMSISGEVNSFATQYFPSLTLDETQLLFTARRSLDYRSDEDLYISYRSAEDSPWGFPEPLPSSINSSGNEGTATLSSDGRMLIFTACQRPDGFGSCDLYISHYNNGSWEAAKVLNSPINTNHWESQPSLSLDGRELYFSSDRPGGKGRKDLWYSAQDSSGNWQKPQNMGPSINTFMDEISPFIHANHSSLYFSSNGHVGLGGFDIFLSEKDQDQWLKARNLGYPLNDWHNQVSLVVNRRGNTAYYTHEEAQSSGLQKGYLYKVILPMSAQMSRRAPLLKGTVRDAISNAPLVASLELFVLGKARSTYQIQSEPTAGSYAIVLPEGEKYLLYAQAKGYLLKSASFSRTLDDVQELHLLLDPLRKGSTQVLEHVYFAHDSYQIDSLSVTELRVMSEFLRENTSLRIEISGHTDNTGTPAYNHQLSERRARAVYQFLIQEGINSRRVQYRGYGETRPQQPNDSEARRAANRRIEFSIIE